MQLGELRDELVSACLRRRDEAPIAAALDAISRTSDAYQGWVIRHATERGLEAFAALPRPSPEEVARVLRGTAPLIRNGDDLALVVKQILEEPWDPALTALLWDDGNGAPKPRRERQVQALVESKLSDGLKLRTKATVTLAREPLEHGTDEPDFL